MRLKYAKYRFKVVLYAIAMKFFPLLFFTIQHKRLYKKYTSYWYKPNIRQPKTFNEKVIYSKWKKEHLHLSNLVDKELVKEHVKKILGKDISVPTTAIYKNASECKRENLDYPCILKATHSSNKSIILHSIEDFKAKEVSKNISYWLKTNHYATSGEPQYKNLKPKVICESLLQPKSGKLMDYKVFCFEGKAKYIQVDIDRFGNHKRQFYDLNWVLQPFTTKHNLSSVKVEKPSKLLEMIGYAESMAGDFGFVRVDFYYFDDQVYFGELTFHQASGYEPFNEYKYDLMLGKMVPRNGLL